MVDWTPTIDVAAEGVPGSGKTTWLLEKLREELDRGVPLEDVVLTTYRRPMAEDLQKRVIGDIDGIDSFPDEHSVRTTHSICYRLINQRGREVITDSQKREAVSGVMGDLHYGGSSDDLMDDTEAAGGGVADTLFQYRGYCIQSLLDPVEGWRGAERALGGDKTVERVGRPLVREFNEAYEAYKDENDLLDFDDMLLEVWRDGLTPRSPVLMEDEFQDKTPLQIAIHDQWSNAADRVYVAGDIYQALYGYQGTDPEFMQRALDEAEESVVLDTSYRFGPMLWDTATDILRRAGYDVPDIEAIGETDIKRVSWSQYVALAGQNTETESLHLARTNRHVQEMATELSNLGIPFDTIGDRGKRWSDVAKQKYNAVLHLREAVERNVSEFGYADYSDLDTGTIETVLPLLPATGDGDVFLDTATKGDAIASVAADPRGFELEDWLDQRALMGLFGGTDPFEGLVASKLGDEEIRERMRSAYRMMEGQRIGTIQHTCATIHGSKGRDAPTVFLLDKESPKAEKDSDPMEEARVWYVGTTRAEDRLYVVNPRSGPDWKVPF